MADVNDNDLIRDYADRNSEPAFAELVRRHVNLVHSVALRFTRNAPDAQDVTQAVFIILARKAATLRGRATLAGWLYETTRLTARQHLRTMVRRQSREQEAYMQSILNDTDTDASIVWRQLEALLEEGMARLDEKERALLALRFLENKSGVETAALLGVGEWAAHKRKSRALEKLRKFFGKRGVTVSVAMIAAAISTHAAQAAPVSLAGSAAAVAFAKGAGASGPGLALANSALKFMAWMKLKTAIILGAGVLLAAGATSVVVDAVNAPADDVVNRLAHQSGKTIVCDRHIAVPPTFTAGGLPFEEAMDQLAAEAGAYWTVDYAVYDSDRSLKQLLAALRDGAALEPAGWSNLSSRPLTPRMQVIAYRGGGGMSMGGNAGSDMVGMIVTLNREASMQRNRHFQEWAKEHRNELENGNGPPSGPDSELRGSLEKAMKDGMADGVLAPERLLADAQLVSHTGLSTPASATPETAARAARAAHAKWTTIYTLRKSPVDGAGIKLIHAGQRTVYGKQNMLGGFSPENIMKRLEQQRYTLTADERIAHDRAAAALKQKP